jgi:hypothetical protein
MVVGRRLAWASVVLLPGTLGLLGWVYANDSWPPDLPAVQRPFNATGEVWGLLGILIGLWLAYAVVRASGSFLAIP